MISSLSVIIVSLVYLSLLFLIAWYTERSGNVADRFSSNALVYSLSLAVYCTAWTFYGSIGRVGNNGFQFLAVYIGPTLVAPLWYIVTRKLIRISKTQRLGTIADFISSRYGGDIALGIIVTAFCFLGVVPYMSLQLKAIAESFAVMTGGRMAHHMFDDKAFMVTLGLVVFSILFGARNAETTGRNKGLIAAIAIESLVKLGAFLVAGVFVVFVLFNGPADLFGRFMLQVKTTQLITVGNSHAYFEWFCICMLSASAATFLPRQYQVGVVENANENHVKQAMWQFPLYMLLINLFVIPIAFAGMVLLGGNGVNGDYTILQLPLSKQHNTMALLIYIGGLSASTSMIIVECIALSTMLSNNIVVPVMIQFGFLRNPNASNLPQITLFIRRLGIFLILMVSYIYYNSIGNYFSLVSIGLTSFVAIAQFLPAILGGLFWKQASKTGVIAGMLVGFAIWFFTLVMPAMGESGLIDAGFIANGVAGIKMLKPYALFGMEGFSPITHATIWSLLLNFGLFMGLSVWLEPSVAERRRGELFVDIWRYADPNDDAFAWKGIAYVSDIEKLLGNFVGKSRAGQLLRGFANRYQLDFSPTDVIHPKLVNYTERILSGYVGAASARMMIGAVTKEEEPNREEMMQVLEESRQLILLNKELLRRTNELQKAKTELETLYGQLKRNDELKDDFLATVTHELRTPITSIRAFSEILEDNPELNETQRQSYLGIITKETERISRLITQVLDLEKYESGKQQLNIAEVDLQAFVKTSTETVQQLLEGRKLNVEWWMPENERIAAFDEDKMMQVVINLLSNAIKFTSPETGIINFSVWPESGMLVMKVSDNGKGIPDELKELIFDKFYQAENQALRKPKGSGLGLAISRRIVLLHSGHIYAETNEGGGAVFVVKLPLDKVNTDIHEQKSIDSG